MAIKQFLKVVYGLFFFFLLGLGVLALLLFLNHLNLTKSEQVRSDSYVLADELRQSSDDLTRFVRTYVATGDPKYEQYYWDVLAIRNGEKPRPRHYERIYWDLFAAYGKAPRPSTRAVPLQQLMKNMGFTRAEFAKLREAQRYSNALVRTEDIAMHAMKGLYDDGTGHFTRRGKPDQAMAIRLMHDAAYHREKARIMKPIDEFFAMLDARTGSTMEKYARRSNLYIYSILGILIALMLLVSASAVLVRRKVSAPITALQNQTQMVAADLDRLAGVAKHISKGDLTQSFTTHAQPLRLEARDEISQLARTHDKMIVRLQETGGAIAKITSDLTTANRELEAFAYSVSHDLRAPLRSIDGFSLALFEDYTDKLDETGKDLLQRVRAAAQRMGQLIDDLLRLSRVTRMEMHREKVDLSAMAQEIAAALKESDPERRVAFVIAPGVIADGDAQLLRIVQENLLGNAWKFTSKHESGTIEFGARRKDAEMEYYVRDDGAGFDAAYSDKLFAPFQRLHSVEEFSGTGIGLAIVQRIILRHGGRVWAEGAVEKGATFYFTL